MPDPLLQAKAITKSFAGVRALRGVSFELLPGEVHALVGENGAGKSTLIKVITGAVRADSGVLVVDRKLGIAAVYQQPSLFPHLSVAENIALALEPGSAWRRVNWKAQRRRALELIERAGASLDPERLVSTLSMPEQQIVEIAKAIGADAKILIMDEPTSSLTDREVENLFKVIAVLRDEDAGIIYVSHRLEEIFAIADRTTVLRDGEAVATCRKADVDRAEIIRMMVGREVAAVFPKREVPIGEPVLELRGVRNVSLSVRAGEILGVFGLVGSGRTELAETIFGLRPAGSGEILLKGRRVRIDSPADAIRFGIGYVPEDRRQHGVIAGMQVAANIGLADLNSVSRHGLIDSRQEHALARRWVEQLGIKTPSVYSETGALSGGNQQKVALSRWLATNPAVLILDEPTQGVDIGSKSEIHSLMVDLAGRGMAILMISSELPEILGMSDRIAVMHSGTIRGVLSRADATPQAILSLALHPGSSAAA